MHHLDLFDALSHIVPAAPAVVCDPGVRLQPDDVWCDGGARIYGMDVWCDPGVRLDPPAMPPAPPAALWLDVEPAWELPRVLPDRRVPLPTIPTSLSFEERVTQRVGELARRLGWDDAVAGSLLKEILEAGSPDHVLVRVVEDLDACTARALHTAWELRSVWASDGPEQLGPMTWHLATTVVTCWYCEDSDADDMLSWLDDAFKVWRDAHPYSYSSGFHVDLMGWLEAEGADALAYGEFPWDGLLPDRHTSEPRW